MSAAARDHSTHHSHGSETRLLIAAALTVATLIAEAIGGWMSGSLALLSDAAHMLIDAFALLLAWAGAHFARRPADDLRSFGYARLEVLAGYSNSLLQFVLVVWIAVEAVLRLMQPEPILSGIMLVVALIGLAVNVVVLAALGGHHHDDLNLAGARLHVIGDLLGSIGAVAAALVVRYLGWLQADPLVSLFVSALILASAWRLLRRSAHILLEGVPDGVETALVTETVRRESGVSDVHHVHVWQLAGGRRMATLHARLAPDMQAEPALASMKRVLREHFHIFHATIQIEDGACAEGDCHGDTGDAHAGHHHGHQH
ncbi:MAG TPA: cation diffusion facilitator family transporter [Rudaea sp.]|nr:cation diffusion facilitator family transporter [Rudaea sp.]HSC11601.1 cation diffusion facilitator family transporter [Rhodanobacteraceae bacterium]